METRKLGIEQALSHGYNRNNRSEAWGMYAEMLKDEETPDLEDILPNLKLLFKTQKKTIKD